MPVVYKSWMPGGGDGPPVTSVPSADPVAARKLRVTSFASLHHQIYFVHRATVNYMNPIERRSQTAAYNLHALGGKDGDTSLVPVLAHSLAFIPDQVQSGPSNNVLRIHTELETGQVTDSTYL